MGWEVTPEFKSKIVCINNEGQNKDSELCVIYGDDK